MKKKTTKPRIRMKNNDGWESVNWSAKTISKTGRYPAWRVSKGIICLDLAPGISWELPHSGDMKLVAQLIGRLVNKYHSKQLPFTNEISYEIKSIVEKYISKTSNMYEIIS